MKSAAKIKITLGTVVLAVFLLVCFAAVHIEILAKKKTHSIQGLYFVHHHDSHNRLCLLAF